MKHNTESPPNGEGVLIAYVPLPEVKRPPIAESTDSRMPRKKNAVAQRKSGRIRIRWNCSSGQVSESSTHCSGGVYSIFRAR